jgi:predicted Kef-type K+ transport protein
MVALILFGKFAIWFGVVRLFGYPSQTALRVGVGLTQIGEFSFILAQVSLHAGLIGSNVYNATLAASLFTIMVNATVFKLSEACAYHTGGSTCSRVTAMRLPTATAWRRRGFKVD